ncbi:FAD-dependent monooxygenase [Nonomuraea sp. NPDC049725]|uniref:FAD-dependent monooxygenase n=1 Tax=Nonomuraea sp. NPDC049725 TaxID=3154508 RepID=UPI00342D63EC
MDVLVIGAGVGGLAVARSLLAAGHRVRIFERAESMRTGGAGLSIFSNGAAVLHDLGVSLDGAGGRFDRIDAMTSDGRLRLRSDMTHAEARYGFANKSVSRRVVLERLAERLPGDLIRFGTGCRSVTQDADRVTAVFDDGSTATGDLLVGADGHHSVVRRELWGDVPIRTAAFGTWQALSRIDIDLARTHVHLMITGREGACGLIPAGDGNLQWWFDVRWKPGDPRPAAPLAELRRRFGHWASPVPEVLAQASESDLDFFGHHWQKVRREWGKGRVTLVGDAAHLMPPTLGQGANQTFEDAWVLGRELAKGGDVAQRLRAYERARYKHVSLVSSLARRSPANWRIPPVIGRLFSETSQSGMLARFSNRLTAAAP